MYNECTTENATSNVRRKKVPEHFHSYIAGTEFDRVGAKSCGYKGWIIRSSVLHGWISPSSEATAESCFTGIMINEPYYRHSVLLHKYNL